MPEGCSEDGSRGPGTLPPLTQSIMKYVSIGDSCTRWKKSLTWSQAPHKSPHDY
jgi:hypothetical protein